MGQLSLGDLNFFFFVIPGFVIVWSFRYFTRSKKTGDFEYLGLSLVWGLALVIALEGWITLTCWLFNGWGCVDGDPAKTIQQVLSNPYGFAALFSVIGMAIGWIGSGLVFLAKRYHWISGR